MREGARHRHAFRVWKERDGGNCQYDLRKRKKVVPGTLHLLTNIGGVHDGPLPVLSLVHAASGRCVVLSQPRWGKPILTATNGPRNCGRNRVGMVGHLRRQRSAIACRIVLV